MAVKYDKIMWVIRESDVGTATDPNNLWRFADIAALQAAHPTGIAGEFAQLGSTDTFWIRDTWTTAWVNSGGSAVPKTYTTATDPALNAACTTVMVDAYAGTIITTTTTWNNQTMGAPTAISAGLDFTVVNDDISTNVIDIVANSINYTLEPWEAQRFIWDGSVWIAVEAVDASDITAVPFGTITWTNVQTQITQVDTRITALPVPKTVGTTGNYLTINAAVWAGEYRLILVSDTTEPANTVVSNKLDVDINWYTVDFVDYGIQKWTGWYLKIYNWSISRIFDTFGEIIFVWFSTVDNSLIVEDVELTIVGTSYGEWGRGWKYTRCVFNPWNGNGAWYSNFDVVTDCIYNGGGTSNYNVINNCDVLNCEMNGTFSSSIICGWPNSRINWLTWTASQGWIGWNWYNIFLPNCNLGSGCNLTNFELRTGNSLSGNKLTNWLFSWTPITSSSIAWNNVFNGVTFTQAQTIQGSWNSFTNCEVTNGTLTVDTAMDKTILVGNRTQTAIVDNWTNTEMLVNVLL